MRYLDLLHDVIDTYGRDNQLVVAVEELSELQKEITKVLRGGGHLEQIAEEMADVQICLDQLEIIFGNHSKVAEWQRMKTQRLVNLLEEKKQEAKGYTSDYLVTADFYGRLSPGEEAKAEICQKAN